MANIRNSISMVDRMTPTLRAILKSMDSMMKVMSNLDRAANNGVVSKAYQRAEKDIQVANNKLKQMVNYNLLVKQGTDEIANSWDRVNKSMNRSKGGFGRIFSGLAGGIYSIKSVGQAISKVTNIADSSISDIAKLSLFNNTGNSNLAMYGQVYKTAQASRSGLSETAGLAQRIAMSGVYKGNGALNSAIDLAGTINKAMVLGGGTANENSRAVLQLSQALASGTMQGDELRSIREQSPYLAQILAEGLGKVDDKFIGTTIGDLKELGAQGELTSDVVIKAFQAMRGQIDDAFDDKAPKTFSGAIQSIANTVQYFMAVISQSNGPIGKFKEVLWDIADYLATPQGFEMMSTIIPVLNIAVMGFQALGWAIQFVGNNMSWIGPIMGAILAMIVAYNAYLLVSKAITVGTGIVQGIAAVAAYARAKAENKAALAAAAGSAANTTLAATLTAEAMATSAATAAQYGMNAALYACPLTWILLLIIAIIAIIFIVVGIINKATGSSMSAIGIIVGALATAVAFIWNLFLGLLDLILGIINYLVNPILSFVNFFANVFKDPIGSVVHLFGDMADRVLGVIETIAKALDKVFGSSMAETVAGWRTSLNATIESKAQEWGNGAYEEVVSSLNLSSDSLGLKRWAYTDAWDSGYAAGEGIQNSLGEFSLDSLMGDMGAMETEVAGGHLDSVGGDVNISDEDIKLLRDMAARDYLLQLQSVTPVAHVTFGDVRETADVGKIVEVIETMIEEQMATSLVS